MKKANLVSIASIILTAVLVVLAFLIPGFPFLAFIFLPFPSIFCYRNAQSNENRNERINQCPHCGKILIEGNESYCPQCGKKLREM